ncbi:MAG: hypothetical protein JSU65_02965 [Candidatus Zixiibacteriota bacterium]|nr:MAG: hypothetical protein JSU65_02965 [candidate division Zixibacteria bacterium]
MIKLSTRVVACAIALLLLAGLAYPKGDDKKDTGTATASAVTVEDVRSAAEEALKKVDRTSAAPMTGEQIKWQVIGAGGGTGQSTNFILSGTAGQTAVGSGGSDNYSLLHGFWQDLVEGGCCVGLTGNVDGVEPVDIGDLTALIDFLFISFTPPDCMEEANVDGVDPVDIGDLTALIDFLFISFTPPAPCS